MIPCGVLRMAIQLLWQVQHALPAGDPLAETLQTARDRIDRDVVDARRQLEFPLARTHLHAQAAVRV